MVMLRPTEIAVIDHITSMKTHNANVNFDLFSEIGAAVASVRLSEKVAI